MRFTERELTLALEGAAKSVLAAQVKDVRKGRRSADDAWTALTGHQRYVMLDALGTQLLGVLVALPDVEVAIGTRPTFTDAQVEAAIREQGGDDVRGLRAKVVLKAPGGPGPAGAVTRAAAGGPGRARRPGPPVARTI